MRKRGFAYVRQFAILPSDKNARWLIPLDSGAVAAGALRLHHPYKPIARAKFAVARAAVATGVPFFPSAKVGVVQRTSPPLERLLLGLFGGSTTRIGMSVGTGGFPKPSFVVLSRSGRAVAFGKIAETPFRRLALENEARALSYLAARDGVRGSVPGLIFAGDVDGRLVTLQRPLEGKPGPRAFTTAHRTFLGLLATGETRPVASSEFVLSIGDRIAGLGGRPHEHEIWRRLRSNLEGVEIAAVNVHGDFAPWNLRRASGNIAAFDWEWWSTDGPPLVDEVHHRLQAGFLLDGWTAGRAFEELRPLALSRPFGLDPNGVYALASVGVLDYLIRIIADGYPEEGSLALQYRELLARMLASLGDSS